jgi:hypothetical protein
MNITGRIRSGTRHVEEVTGSRTQNPFREMRSAGVPGAEDEDEWLVH